MKKVFFYNRQKEKLSGLLFTPKTKKKLPALIFCHGFCSSKYTKIALAKKISQKGFTVLIFDAAGCGESQGSFEYHTVSKYVSDLKSAVGFMEKVQNVDKKKVIIAGHSLGAMVTVIFASKYNDACMIIPIDPPCQLLKNRGPNSHLGNSELLKKWKMKGSYIFAVRINAKRENRKLSFSFIADGKKYNLMKSIKKVKCPVIFIQGDSDRQVLPEETKKLYKMANKPKELIIVKGVNHIYRGKNQNTLEKVMIDRMKKYL